MENKNNVKAGLTFGIPMAGFFIIQNLLTHGQLSPVKIIMAILFGLLAGATAGFLFGWTVGRFSGSKRVIAGTAIETDPGETILFETGANHFKGWEAVGGKLYLTSKRLVFKSHKLNLQNHQFSVGIAEIQSADRSKTFGVVDNGILVRTTDGKTERFVVQQPAEWAACLLQSEGIPAGSR